MNRFISSGLSAFSFVKSSSCLRTMGLRAMSTGPVDVTLHFVGPDDFRMTVVTKAGRNLMKVAKAHHIDYLPCVCNGQIECSTCHVKIQDDDADNPNDITSQATLRMTPPSIPEMDMLDIAADVDNNSRLACQVVVSPQMDGVTIKIPDNMCNYMDDPSGTAVPTRLLRV